MKYTLLKLSWKDIFQMEESEIYSLIYPDKGKFKMDYEPIDYECVHKELVKKGVTLKLLWIEYMDKAKASGNLAMGYDKFCKEYHTFVEKNNYTSHLLHKPGMTIETDWAGKTMSIVDRDTGEILKVYIFVSVLPYSQYAFVQAVLSMDSENWIQCHVDMYEYFGGVTQTLVCDNLKTGVVSHPMEGEIILNEAYENMAEYYGTAILPTGVRKPKEKPSAEGTVGKITTSIIGKLRNNTYETLQELRRDVRKELDAFNERPFQKRDGSRKSVFESMEKSMLKPLPKYPYEIATWVHERKVYPNSHVSLDKNFYSVPYQYIGCEVDLRVTSHIVEIYDGSKRIASHPRFASYIKNAYQTDKSHLAPASSYTPWNEERLLRWAAGIGPNTKLTIQRLLDKYEIKEQGFNPALSVLKLSKKYSEKRLENACLIALKTIYSPRYKHLNSILSNNQDVTSSETPESEIKSDYVRGADFYSFREDK